MKITRPFNLKKWMVTSILLIPGLVMTAQFPFRKKKPQVDTTAKTAVVLPTVAKVSPKPYSEVITNKAKTEKGLFLVHKVEDKYYFEIPDSMISRDFLVMAHLVKAPGDGRLGFAGDEVNSNVISFQKGPDNKLFLLLKSFAVHGGDSTGQMYNAVTRSNMQAIIASFDIKAFSKDSNGVVIDFTDLIKGDNRLFHFTGVSPEGAFAADKSYITSIRSFPNNINIGSVRTYGNFVTDGKRMTLELNTSIVALPRVPMKPRYADARVGYFTTEYTDFEKKPQGVKNIVMARRWKLEPKPGDIEKYKRGELVEPAKPIIIYIDPATPSKWVPYLMQGVNDWQSAFEKAGFKNAIMARRAPTPLEDSTWSMYDARNSVIVYEPSTQENAMGPSTADPRSGEILETHVRWYHNVMKLLRDWYFVQASPNDPRARKMQFDDELMGQLIRFVSSHEVGHTLGLMHNMGSSSTVPVEMLRNKKWVEENGHTPSIMDYARFNYVAQPEDNISEKGLFPRIGDYDKWAIEWGYKWTDQSVDAETSSFSTLTTEKQKNKRLWYGTQANDVDHRSQTEDLGDNAMLAGTYGIKNLQRIMPNLEKWTAEPDKGYDNLELIYKNILAQFG